MADDGSYFGGARRKFRRPGQNRGTRLDLRPLAGRSGPQPAQRCLFELTTFGGAFLDGAWWSLFVPLVADVGPVGLAVRVLGAARVGYDQHVTLGFVEDAFGDAAEE